MLSSRTIRSFTLFVIGVAFFNFAFTITSWYKPLVLPLRKGSRWLDALSDVSKVSRLNMKPRNEATTKKQPREVTESSSRSSLITLWTSEINIENLTIDIIPETERAENSSLQNEGSKQNDQALCPEIPPGLGPISKTLSLNASEIVRNSTSPGGYYTFNGCTPRQRIAIIIPLRASIRNISYTFLFHLHTFLIQQQVEYRVFIVGQNNSKQTFIRGRLINVGFMEIRQRFNNIHCFVIQEPNIMSMDTRNLYRCSWYPRQLAVHIERRDKSMFFPKFGHAVALTDEQFSKANGFSNLYRPYNSDYDQMLQRLEAVDYTLEKCPFAYGKFAYLFRQTDVSKLLKISSSNSSYQTDLLDGIATLAYIVACYEVRDYYTYISVHFPEDVQNVETTGTEL